MIYLASPQKRRFAKRFGYASKSTHGKSIPPLMNDRAREYVLFLYMRNKKVSYRSAQYHFKPPHFVMENAREFRFEWDNKNPLDSINEVVNATWRYVRGRPFYFGFWTSHYTDGTKEYLHTYTDICQIHEKKFYKHALLGELRQKHEVFAERYNSIMQTELLPDTGLDGLPKNYIIPRIEAFSVYVIK
jgi:hypothetical protein